MIHHEEYYTCDRCGAFINPKFFFCFPVQRTQKFDIHTDAPKIKAYISGNIETLLDDKIAMEITETYSENSANYHLCYKCRKDFERFMRNETI